MKKILSIFIVLIYSCSSDKIITSYLETEKDACKNILITNKIKSNDAIDVLFGVGESKNSNDLFVNNKSSFSLNDFYYLKTKYKKDTIVSFWRKDKFKFYTYSDESNLNKKKYEINNFGNDTINVYQFSNPIFLRNKEYAFFKISKNRTLGQKFIYSKCVVMKKVNNKWIIYKQIDQRGIFN